MSGQNARKERNWKCTLDVMQSGKQAFARMAAPPREAGVTSGPRPESDKISNGHTSPDFIWDRADGQSTANITSTDLTGHTTPVVLTDTKTLKLIHHLVNMSLQQPAEAQNKT